MDAASQEMHENTYLLSLNLFRSILLRVVVLGKWKRVNLVENALTEKSLTENVFVIGRGLRESPRFHDVAKSVGAKRVWIREWHKANLMESVWTEKSFDRKCF